MFEWRGGFSPAGVPVCALTFLFSTLFLIVFLFYTQE